MPYEPISKYPRLGARHALYCMLWALAFGAAGGFVARHQLAAGEGLFSSAAVLMSLVYGAALPVILLGEFKRPKVRIGPDWIESYNDHLEKLWREELADLVGVLHESDVEICFELRDGRDFRIRRKHVGRGDWNELRAELAYRLDFYQAPEPRPSRLGALLRRA